MSRTHKTSPLWVKAVNGHGARVAEVHNHRNGECNLPPEPDFKYSWFNVTNTMDDCFWDWRWIGTNVCDCCMCTGKLDHKWENRKSRHNSKSAIKKADFDNM